MQRRKSSISLQVILTHGMQPSDLYSRDQITHFLSFLLMFNALLHGFYDSLLAFKQGFELEGTNYLIVMETIKTVFSLFIGFILDQLQFTLNVLNVIIVFSILTNFYFMFYIAKEFSNDQFIFLYISLGFQTIGHLGQMIFSITTIAKINNFEVVGKKIALMLRYWYIGKILKFPISLLALDKLYYEIISLLILFIYIAEFIFSQIYFKHIKYYCSIKNELLTNQDPDNSDSFYNSIKKTIQCPNFLISLCGALSISISQTFLKQQQYYTNMFFKFTNKKEYYFYSELLSSIPFIFGILFLLKIEDSKRYFYKLQQSSFFGLIAYILLVILRSNFLKINIQLIFKVLSKPAK